MDFMIIAGPGQTGKTTFLQQQIIDTTIEEPEQRIIYIVPEQSTLMVQQQLLNKHPRHGILKVEILSFNRMAYRVLQETGSDQDRTLDDMGKSMLLYKIALDHQDELIYYKDSIRKQGFIGQLKIMMTEIYQYRLDSAFFDRILSNLDQDSTLYRKLHDIRILTDAFREKTTSGQIPTEQLLDLLEEKIPESQILDGADIYMDDFFGFTPQQYGVLDQLWKKARRVRMTLPIDSKTLKSRHADEGSMYYQSVKILKKLEEMGIQEKVRYLDTSYKDPVLRTVTEEMLRVRLSERIIEDPDHKVRVYKTERPEDETEWVLSSIMRDVQFGGLRFEDTAMLVGSQETYLPLIERLAGRYKIPVFLDRRAELNEHPAVRMLMDALYMVTHRYTYDAVFSWAKSGYLPYPEDRLDQLENMALKWGLRGRERYKAAFQELCEEDEELRERTETIFEALKGLESGKAPADQYTEAFILLMRALGLESQLAEQAAFLQEEGQASKAAFYEQTYEAVLAVLEQMHLVLGTETVDLESYSEILNTGLLQSRIGILPPAPDQVQVADLTRSRIANVRSLYIMGFQDESFPQIAEDPGLLSDVERKKISTYHDVAADRTLRMGEQIFYLYNALGKASDKVTFTYSTTDGQGASKRPSTYVQQLNALLGKQNLYTREEALPMHPDWLLDRLSRGLEPAPKEASEKKWLKDHDRGPYLDLVEQGRLDELPEEALGNEELWKLAGLDRHAVSVTQLEQYARCPFSYFLRYGLNLKEREILDVRPLDDGNVLHELLENVGAELAREEVLSEQEIEARMDRILEIESEQFSRYLANSRFRYYWGKLKNSAVKAIRVLTEQIRLGEFYPEAFEWTFGGPGGGRKALEILLPDGRSMMLMGKIDRADRLKYGEEEFIRIVDYKTGRTSWSLWDVFDGIKLQLPLYMEAYQQQKGGKPAGLFYFHLVPPTQKGDPEQSAADKEREILKSMHLDGLILDDPVIVEKMDENLGPGMGRSSVLPVYITQTGKVSGESKADDDQFQALLAFARKKAAQMGDEIVSGRVEPNPIVEGQTIACSYCPYKNACRLDPARHPEKVRRLDGHKNEKFWESI